MYQPSELSLWLLGAGGLATLASLLLTRRRRRRKAPTQTGDGPGLPQGCVIPFLVQEEKVQVCLISLSNQSGWGFPKGMVDAPETVAAAGLRESFEEAGIRGSIVGAPLGEYSYVKRDVKLVVTVFLMRVTAVEDHWPEKRVRQRQFCSPSQARTLVATAEQRQLLDVAVARLAELKLASD